MYFKRQFLLLFGISLVSAISEPLLSNGSAANNAPIVFVSRRDGNPELYAMDADGGNRTRLTNHRADDLSPTWSPDGKKIAFVSNRNQGYLQIWVMDANGANPIRLTDGFWDERPDWSPDGRKIAFESSRAGRNSEIYVMEADGRNQTRLTHDFGDNRDPTWSPDGRHIAYIGHWDIVSWNIHVIDSDGKNQRLLTKKGWDQDPTWSPDSERIAFSGTDRNGPVWGIYTVDVGSGAVKMISEIHRDGDYQPDWLNPVGLSVSAAGSRVTMWGRLKDVALSLR